MSNQDNNGIKISADDLDTLKAANQEIIVARVGLASLRESYLTQEVKHLQASLKAQADYDTFLRAIASKHKIGQGQNEEWSFDLTSGVFTKKN
jgi:hypothetical protein